MSARSRPRGRRSGSHSGTTDPAGAVVPEPRVRRRTADESPGDTERIDASLPAEVVHVIPTDHLDVDDLSGMSLPVGIGDSAKTVQLPGDNVLTRPDESDIPTEEELDERDARKGSRRKRTGPKPPASTRPDPNTPAESAPPPTEPEPVDPAPADPDSHDHS